MRLTASLQFVNPKRPNARTWNVKMVPGVRSSMIVGFVLVINCSVHVAGALPLGTAASPRSMMAAPTVVQDDHERLARLPRW